LTGSGNVPLTVKQAESRKKGKENTMWVGMAVGLEGCVGWVEWVDESINGWD
jgi:hypothetical protein